MSIFTTNLFRYIVYTLDQYVDMDYSLVYITINLFRYIVYTLDQYVDMDYSLVYFHHGLVSSNKPPLSWLWGLYKVGILLNCPKDGSWLLLTHL